MTIDLIMGILKEKINSYRDMKVVLCSATVNEKQFCKYFNCNFIKIMGRLYPVEVKYFPTNKEDEKIKQANEVIKNICY